MARLIDADAIAKKINDCLSTLDVAFGEYRTGAIAAFEAALYDIEHAPTVEPEPIEPIVVRVNEFDSLLRCGGCGANGLFRRQRYCHVCGRKVKWDADD